MFESLKNKLNKAVKKITKSVSKKEIEKGKVEENKSGIFSFIKEKTISEDDIEDVLWELQLELLEGDVALEVAEKITESVKKELVGKKVKRSTDIDKYTRNALKNAILEILKTDSNVEDLLKIKKKPFVILFVGVNGTGKTTTIAKLAKYFMEKGLVPVIAAADTFRAGAIEQITKHGEKLGVKVIKHKKGSDPAAVAYDAVNHAKSKNKDVVLIDTAGRMQTNMNLMEEMAKIKRVVNPDFIIFVGDALTGNDAVEQAKMFDEKIGIDGVILTKADADTRGGAAISISYVIGKPILFLGIGQNYDDLIEFKPEWVVKQLFT
ncbi:signal recognition particle-docking protein FtsY [Methanothermus fervidus DSM 2088]|uniref:Signal recognition particle receptor FtsY n=1 Tax=Methanothermus fervidus (strain ATCC 43054 / DSM 2088 / JCM 10308 / V24 S) TaxID=523846 RepID=E3GXD4_METFV|nr:signal recognition particle-docking protein FtsY [Methanothermus fervidus]ADP76966.1 signal recognition particle-docking protein FtsY [Methanothermus fervidus DSM 2088]